MLNLIERFFEETEGMRISVSIPEKQRVGEQQEIYFFMGKDAVLCISKVDNKVLSKIPMAQMQVSLLSPTEFSLNVNGQALFFCQNEVVADIPVPDFQESAAPFLETAAVVEPSATPRPLVSDKYPHRLRCEKCTNRKCSQYDALNGRNFRFGSGQVSQDLMEQHERYCQAKIEKFGCAI